LSIIVLCNPAAALLIVLAFRHPLATALTIAASLAQIGEFSFNPRQRHRGHGLPGPRVGDRRTNPILRYSTPPERDRL
jgi:hypothetical protein